MESMHTWSVFKNLLTSLFTGENVSYDDVHHPEFSVGELIELANAHRVIPQISQAFLNAKINDTDLYSHFLMSQKEYHLLRQKIIRDEILEVTSLFEKNDIEYAIRKGIAIDYYAYKNKNLRYFNDIDIAIRPNDISIVKGIMEETEFESESYFDYIQQKVKPLDRKTLLSYKLHPDHIPQYTKLNKSPIRVPVQIDFAFSLSWANSDYPIDISRAFSELAFTEINGKRVKIFNRNYTFIDTFMHLYREAYFKRVSIKGDRITKFLDVYYLWRSFEADPLTDDVVNLIKGYNLLAPLSWVAFHTDNVLNTCMYQEVVQKFGSVDSYTPDNYFNSYLSESGSIGYWKGDMDNRLRIKNRESIYE